MALSFSQGLLSSLTNPSFGGNLSTIGQQIGGLGGQMRANEQAEAEKQRMAQMAALEAAGQGATEAAAQNRVDFQRSLLGDLGSTVSPELAAIQQGAALQAGVKPADVAAARGMARTQGTEAKRQQGIQTITRILNESNPQNENVQKAVRQVALNYGLTQEDLSMLLPGSSTVTRATGTIDVDGKPTLVNFVYDANGRVISKEILGPKSDKPGVEVNIGGDRGEYFKALEKTDAAQVANGMLAQNTLPAISQAKQLVQDNPEVFGAGSDVFDDMRRGSLAILDIAGVPRNEKTYKDISNQTSASALARTLTQEFVQPRMAATIGAISDTEFKTFIASVPNLLQTPEGYVRVLDYMENTLNAQVIYSQNLDSAYQTEEGNTPSEFKRKWSRFSSEVPLGAFNRDEIEQVWQKYNTDGDFSNVNFSVTDPVSNDTSVVSLDTLKKIASKNGYSINTFITNFKNDDKLGLLL